MATVANQVPFRKSAVGRVAHSVRQKYRRIQRELYQRFLCTDEEKRILLILGCQRSGTTMLGNLFSADVRAAVLQEMNVATGAGTLRLRARSEANQILHGLRAPLVVIKPIVESQWAPELLEEIADSRVVWMYRGFRDVIRSNVKRFHSQIEGLRMAVEGEPPSWRNERLSLETQDLQQRYYDPEMPRENAAAIGWHARNSLFFQLGLQERRDVHLLKYEFLVSEPERAISNIYSFLQIPMPRKEIWREVDSSSVGRGSNLAIDSSLEEKCEVLQSRLDECFCRQLENLKLPSEHSLAAF